MVTEQFGGRRQQNVEKVAYSPHLSNGGDCAHIIELVEDEMSVLRCPRENSD